MAETVVLIDALVAFDAASLSSGRDAPALLTWSHTWVAVFSGLRRDGQREA